MTLGGRGLTDEAIGTWSIIDAEMSVLLRFRISQWSNDVELAQSVLWQMGATGIFEPSPGELVVGFTDHEQASNAERSLRNVGERRGWKISINDEPEPVWQPHIATTEVVIATPSGRRILEITANQAFGHGGHPTTQIALELLARFVQPGQNILDLGTGTGVLALAAAALGASVVAIDIDPAAVETAQANAEANGLSIECSTTRLADLADERGACFDLVVANVLLVVHRELPADIAALTKPEGRLVVTGALESQLTELRSLYGPSNDVELYRDGWVGASWVAPS